MKSTILVTDTETKTVHRLISNNADVAALESSDGTKTFMPWNTYHKSYRLATAKEIDSAFSGNTARAGKAFSKTWHELWDDSP